MPHLDEKRATVMTELKKRNNNNTDDVHTKAIGEIGRWQIFLYALVGFPAKLLLPSIHFGIIFMAPKTTFRCLQRRNTTEDIVNLTCYSDCEGYVYYSQFENNIIEQWQLICGRAWLADLAQTICMLGILIGSAAFGIVSDRYGRRWSLIVAGTIETCASFVMPFCLNLSSFLVMRFLLGAASGGTMTTSFILLMEIFGTKKRELLGCIFMLPVSLGHLLMNLIAYHFRSWREFSAGFAIPTLIFLTYIFWLPESPKWLISAGRLEEAELVMTSAAKWNRLPQNNMKATVESLAHTNTSDQKIRGKATVKDLVTLPSLRLKNLFSCLTWFWCGLTFYGSHQYFGQTTSDVILADTLVAIALVGRHYLIRSLLLLVIMFSGFLLAAYVSKVCGRRLGIIGFFIAGSIANAILVLPDEWHTFKLIGGAVGLGCGGAIASLLYVFTSELFPTVARNMGIGTSSTMNKLGSTLAPFISGFRLQLPWIPPVVFAVAAILGAVSCWCLPETKGLQLEDHLEEN